MSGQHVEHERMIGLLETLLREQSREYTSLFELLEQKRNAIAAADVDRIHDLCRRESIVLTRLGELENSRRTLVAALSQSFEPEAPSPLTLRDIANRLREEHAERFITLASALRDQVIAIRRLSQVIAAASQELNAHVTVVMENVQRTLNQTQTYQRQGRLDMTPTRPMQVDLQS
ncbi:MAG: flagellar protein FlgN [Phycisphaerales bacterium]